MEISRTTTINCTKTVLFEYFRDPNNDPDWCSTVHSSELVEGEPGKEGAVYHQMHKPGPFPPSSLKVRLLEVGRPDHIRLESTDDIGTFVVSYTLEDIGDGKTRVTQHDDIRFRGLGRLLAPFITMAVKSGIARQFEELERKAEKDAIPTSP